MELIRLRSKECSKKLDFKNNLKYYLIFKYIQNVNKKKNIDKIDKTIK